MEEMQALGQMVEQDFNDEEATEIRNNEEALNREIEQMLGQPGGFYVV